MKKRISFTKMQGCGNDYVYLNGLEERFPKEKKPELARMLSDRHFGIGGDGVIFINPAKEADFEMEMYNADGSPAQMCGNGIRCVGKYVYDKGLTDSDRLSIVSAGSIKYLELTIEKQSHRGQVSKVRVNMGAPILQSDRIPVCSKKERTVNEPISVCGKEYRMTCVSMGNPHAVVFMDAVKDLKLDQLGPFFEHHEKFPERINTEFVEVLDRHHVFLRVWERGAGETCACGTGCCAAAVAGVLNGLTENQIIVKLLGGELAIEWDREKDLVFMTGPAVTVFEGEILADF